MLSFNNLQIERLIIHTIVAKPADVPHATATVDPSLELVVINESVEAIIKTRLVDAAGKNGRAFKLSIEKSDSGSFFDLSKKFINCSNEEFIDNSVQIAELLASSQTRSNQPGGFLIILHGKMKVTGLNVFIAIKAEPHEALVKRVVDGKALVELLEKIFLSPSQRLYKIGILEEINSSYANPNQSYNCYLFDYQFSKGMPAEYFYKDFLGFSIDSNSKLQSFKFYSMTEQFIENSTTFNSDEKNDLLYNLGLEFKANKDISISPIEFAEKYFGDEDIVATYNRQVAESLPQNIKKDKALISHKLSSKKIKFPRNINISGPFEDFNERVKIINKPSNLSEDFDKYTNGTLVYIAGKPFDKE